MSVVENVEQAAKPRVSVAVLFLAAPMLIVAVMLLLVSTNRSTSPTEAAPEVGFENRPDEPKRDEGGGSTLGRGAMGLEPREGR